MQVNEDDFLFSFRWQHPQKILDEVAMWFNDAEARTRLWTGAKMCQCQVMKKRALALASSPDHEFVLEEFRGGKRTGTLLPAWVEVPSCHPLPVVST
ncbi:hypothetical protein KSB_62130 [Ktedonobacter robiniae]|uniref:Uncharacterized protein n=1 Tax=Ktedonobacter robiniae TaxID=2778365 RepID=A0ABQ3UYI9_9CHLR|nr:hypothetical protein KSB_62130 [Ktedonobacter robiniae]